MSRRKIKGGGVGLLAVPVNLIVLERMICDFHRDPVQALWRMTLPDDPMFDDLEFVRKKGRGPFTVCDACAKDLTKMIPTMESIEE